MAKKVSLFWYRRDLRLRDNAGLYHALKADLNVVPVFIFDQTILEKLPDDDKRVLFIHQTVAKMKAVLQKKGSDLLVYHGEPLSVLKQINEKYKIGRIYTNHDYETVAIDRDLQVAKWASAEAIEFHTFKDQCIFEKNEVVSDTRKPYTVFTPYKKKWLSRISPFYLKSYPTEKYENNFLQTENKLPMPTMSDLGFKDSDFVFPEITVSEKMLKEYSEKRDYPALDGATSRLGLHLRFGTVSIRQAARLAQKYSDVWLSELIWRDFFMQILWQFPHVQKESFRPQYEKVGWRKAPDEFKK